MFLALAYALALSSPPSRIEAVDVVTTAPSAIRVSGQVSEEVWQRVTSVDAFVQREPQEGGVPSQRTEFRVAYDSATLFVKVRAFDTDPARIVSYLTRRDDDSPSDSSRATASPGFSQQAACGATRKRSTTSSRTAATIFSAPMPDPSRSTRRGRPSAAPWGASGLARSAGSACGSIHRWGSRRPASI